MGELVLPALTGTNPLGFLAALGVLDALSREDPSATLRWTNELIPRAVVTSASDFDGLLDLLERDRERWAKSVVLGFPDGDPQADAKPDSSQLRLWFRSVLHKGDVFADGNLLCALVAEDAFDGNKKAKPTHLHFTAGQQRFLEMVRMLAQSVDRDRFDEAVRGPWRYDSNLPSLSWDARGERIYAVRATNPSNDKRLGVPGADWLAFRGLVFYPVKRTEGGSLRTTACDIEWKRGALRWPLWSLPCTSPVAASLVADSTVVGERAEVRPEDLGARGIFAVHQAPIRRNDQGGYGSFGAPDTLGSATPPNGDLG
jgi:hypothetical protein